MKKTVTYLLLLIFVSYLALFGGTFTSFASTDSENLSSAISRDYTLFESKGYVVFDKSDQVNRYIIDESLNNGEFVLVYDIHPLIDEPTEPVQVATFHYRDNGINYTRSLSTNETNITVLENDVNNVAKEFQQDVFYHKANLHTDDTQSQINMSAEPHLGNSAMAIDDGLPQFTQLSDFSSGEYQYKPYGKISYTTYIAMCEVSPQYNLYIAKTDVEFMPGHALRSLGDTTYNRYISKEARQISSVERREKLLYGGAVGYGEQPNVLEYWPKNMPVSTTIHSSFGGGGVLGYSSDDGFSGQIIGNYEYPQSYTTTSPTMNAATMSMGEQYGWYFSKYNVTTEIQTTHFNSGVMLEMENGNFCGEFQMNHKLWFRVDKFLAFSREIEYNPYIYVYAYNVN